MSNPEPRRRARKKRSAAALVFVVLACCNRGSDTVPLDMYTLGASFREIDSIAGHVEARRFVCLPDVAPYRECWLKSPDTYRFTILTLDTEDRAIAIRQKLDSAQFRAAGKSAVSTQSKRNYLTAQWSAVGEKRPVLLGPPMVETWASRGGGWTARIVTEHLDQVAYLSEIAVRGEDARDYINSRNTLLADSIDMDRVTASTAPHIRRMRDELERVMKMQRVRWEASGRFASTLQQLHYIPNAEHLISIGSGGTEGWWARVARRDGASEVCYIWSGAAPSPLHAKARAGTLPEIPYCRSAAVQPETQPHLAEPSRSARRARRLNNCADSLGRLRASDPVDTNPPNAVARAAGVFITPGVHQSPRHGRVISLWQVGRRWRGSTEIWVGEAEPLRGTIVDGYSQQSAYSPDDVNIRFRVVYEDGFFDSYNVAMHGQMLGGRVITQHRRCPGMMLSVEGLSLQADMTASATQPANHVQP